MACSCAARWGSTRCSSIEDIGIRRADDIRVTVCGVEIDPGVRAHAVAYDKPRPEHDCTDQIDEVECEECLRLARQRWPT
jgi:hypothetical protein